MEGAEGAEREDTGGGEAESVHGGSSNLLPDGMNRKDRFQKGSW